jgi:DNA-binding transcriptional MerR regulator
MTEQPLHTPTAAASLITDPRTNQTVNAYTLRRWCAAHAEFLSPGANPGKDAQRRLTERDVEVLREVARLRSTGMATADINAQLPNLTFAVVTQGDDKVVNPVNPTVDNLDITPTQPLETPHDAPDGPSMLPAVLTGIDSRFQAIEARLEAQAAEQRARVHLAITMLVLGAILGVVLVIVLQLVANGVQ